MQIQKAVFVENTMKKRILFINYLIWKPSDPGFRGKYEKFSRYYEGHIFHLGDGKEVRVGRFVFHSFPWKSNIIKRQLGFLFFCLSKAPKNGPYDAIICYDPLLCGITGVIIKRITGAKLVIEVNSDHFWRISKDQQSFKVRFVWLIRLIIMHLSLKFANGVKFINKPLAESYSRIFGLARKKASNEIFFNFAASKAFRKTGPNSGGPILCVGHPYDIKGVDILLKAFNLISHDYPDVRLHIVGHCDDRGPYENLAQGNPLISFHKGMFFRDIVSEFENCRFFVLPSRTEGIPRVLLEAMACGKAVIGSRVGGIPEVIIDNETGLMFESGNYRQLAEKMRLLLDDPDFEKRLGNAGHERVKNHFSPEVYLQKYHVFLEGILSTSPRRS